MRALIAFLSLSLLTSCSGTERAQPAPEPDVGRVLVPTSNTDSEPEDTAEDDSSTPIDSTVTDSIADSAPPGDGGCSPCTTTVIGLDVAGTQLASDAKRGLVYTAALGGALKYANELVVIDAATSTVKTSVPIGSEPISLAISDDSSTLWVGLRGSYSIRKVDLTGAAPVPGTATVLPKDSTGRSAHAGPMVVLPGAPASVAVSMHYLGVSPSYAGSVVLDDGVLRPVQLPGHTGASRLTGGPPGFLFGFNEGSSGFQFYSIKVAADGLTKTEFASLVSGYNNDIIYGNNLVFGMNGEVVDVKDPTKPTKAGVLPYKGAILPTTNPNRVLMVTPRDFGDTKKSATLRLLDVTTFTQISWVALPAVEQERIWSLVPAGNNKVAFLGGGYTGSSEPARTFLVTVPWML